MSNIKAVWRDEGTGQLMVPGRLMYPNLLEPTTFKESRLTFNTSLLVHKDVDLTLLNEEMDKIAAVYKTTKAKINPMYWALKDTAMKDSLASYADEYPNFIVAKANADRPPGLFGPDAKDFTGPASEIYSGRWAVLAVEPWGYSGDSKGVSLGLRRVQLRENADRLEGGSDRRISGFEAVSVGAVGATADSLWPESA